MADVVRALFWLWVVGSIAVLAYRWWRRRAAPSGSATVASTRSTTGPASAAAATSSPPDRPVTDGPAAGRSVTDGPSSSSATGGRTEAAAPGATDASSAAAAGAPAGAGGLAPVDDGVARRGLFAPGGGAPQVATIAEALQGIELPCGLTPVIDSDRLHLADKQVVFSTTDAPAAEVGSRFGDALEALGFELRSVGDAAAVATRPDATVELRLHPQAGAPGSGGRPLFPTLPEAAVVLVCELRRS